jgi:transmembrane sensor
MKDERIWNLIARKLSGEATREDLVELFEMLRENPEVHYSLEIF